MNTRKSYKKRCVAKKTQHKRKTHRKKTQHKRKTHRKRVLGGRDGDSTKKSLLKILKAVVSQKPLTPLPLEKKTEKMSLT